MYKSVAAAAANDAAQKHPSLLSVCTWLLGLAYMSLMQTSTISTDDGEGTTISTDEDLADRYSNFKLLSSPSYELYWDVDEPSGNLSLAVRVNTTGWVGFGVSPNGGMPNSDVVMGWVEDDGTVVFQV